jgi:hypothetical protein
MQDGGLDDCDAHLLFRLETETQLRERITALIPRATAWLRSRNAAAYNSVDPDVSRSFRTAECYLTLRYLFEPLKARKVVGTHWPLDQEGSERFEALIDTEWQNRAEEEISPYITVTDAERPICLPGLSVGAPVLSTDSGVQSAEEELQDILDDSRALVESGGFTS